MHGVKKYKIASNKMYDMHVDAWVWIYLVFKISHFYVS